MFDKFKKILSNREVVLKIMITFGLLLAFKAGTYIPIPLFDTTQVNSIFEEANFFGILNAFSGGGLSNYSILALGISPYITSSIIIQMLQLLIPKLKEYSEEGEVGKAKLNKITRWTSVGLALVQALVLLFGLGQSIGDILIPDIMVHSEIYILYYLYMAIVIAAGSAFTMWIADLITRHGIGNGSSMIISAGIISSIPTMFTTLSTKYLGDAFTGLNCFLFILVVVLYFAMILGVVYFEGAQRKIPVQYANRQASQGSDIPIKLNSASVMPVIFASTIMSLPLTVLGLLGYSSDSNSASYWLNQVFSTSYPIGIILYVILIYLFSFFYAFMQFDPAKVSDNLSKSNAFIPAVRPGQETENYLSRVLFKVTLIGATYLAVLALIPIIISKVFAFTAAESSVITIGGTGLLIVVGVAVETMKQLEADANEQTYSGFIE